MSGKHSFSLRTFTGAEAALGEGTRAILREHNMTLVVTERKQEVVIRLTAPGDISDALRQKLVAQENVFGAILHHDCR